MISFFHNLSYSSPPHLFESKLHNTYWFEFFDFGINITTDSRLIISRIVSCRFFRCVVSENSFKFRFFSKRKAYFLVFCLQSHVKKPNIFAKFHGRAITGDACFEICCQHFSVETFPDRKTIKTLLFCNFGFFWLSGISFLVFFHNLSRK